MTYLLTSDNTLQAANYLNIKPLLDLTCLTVANMIKGGLGVVLLW